MVDRCMRMDSSCCDPSRITLNLRSLVIRLGSQLEESFFTHMSTIRFSLRVYMSKPLSESVNNCLEKNKLGKLLMETRIILHQTPWRLDFIKDNEFHLLCTPYYMGWSSCDTRRKVVIFRYLNRLIDMDDSKLPKIVFKWDIYIGFINSW